MAHMLWCLRGGEKRNRGGGYRGGGLRGFIGSYNSSLK